MRGRKFWGVALCALLVLALTAPSFAQDRRGFFITKSDLRHLNPKRHPYFWSIIGGGAIGAAAGELLGSGNDLTKGLLVGAGGASAAYLHSHPHTGGSYRAAEYLFSHTALGTGIGWTLCGCTDGAWGGGLIGFGTSALWQAAKAPSRRTAGNAGSSTTASTTSSNDNLGGNVHRRPAPQKSTEQPSSLPGANGGTAVGSRPTQ